MDKLISAQAAIDAVKKNTFRLTFAEEQNCEGHVAWSADAVYSDVMEGALLELPAAQPEAQWIPCSEPPKESGTYIVTAYDGTNKRVSFVKYQKTLKRWDLTGARAYWSILAYKPLPEPWRGEEHGRG